MNVIQVQSERWRVVPPSNNDDTKKINVKHKMRASKIENTSEITEIDYLINVLLYYAGDGVPAISQSSSAR